MKKVIEFLKENKIVGSLAGGVILFVVMMFLVFGTKKDIEVISFSETGQIVQLEYIEDGYSTFIDINGDGSCKISMWPEDEKTTSYPDIEFKVSKQQIGELEDNLNRYSNMMSNVSRQSDEPMSTYLTVYSTESSTKFSNKASNNDNFDYLCNFIKDNIVPDEIMNEYESGVSDYLNY